MPRCENWSVQGMYNIESVPQWPKIRAMPVFQLQSGRTTLPQHVSLSEPRNGASFCYILIRIRWCVRKFAHACWYRQEWGALFAYDSIVVEILSLFSECPTQSVFRRQTVAINKSSMLQLKFTNRYKHIMLSICFLFNDLLLGSWVRERGASLAPPKSATKQATLATCCSIYKICECFL